MKAAICYEFGQPLIVEDVQIDPPQAGEVKVKLAACAICHSDLLAMDGAWGRVLPTVYGHEAAGIVEAVGPGVTSARAGDAMVVSLLRSCGRCWFCARGDSHLCEATFALNAGSRLHTPAGLAITQGMGTAAFAEAVVVHESQVAAVPAQMPLECASLLACGVITGLGAVTNTAHMPAGGSAVVIGAGGVGLNSIQGARISGAHTIVAVDLLESKLERARAFGATHTVNPGQEDALAAVLALTGGRGADYVFVTVGSADAVEQGLGLARRGGSVVIVGMPASGVKAQIEVADFAYNSQHILGSRMGSANLQLDVPKLVRFYEQGRLKLDELISARYALSEINEAIAAMKRGEALRNVIVF